MATRHDFDTMLCALNHYDQGQQDREGRAIPRAASRDMGVLVMKVIRPREAVEGATAAELLRYALSLEYVTAAVIGTDSLDVVRQNTGLIRNFERLNAAEMDRIAGTLEPLFTSGRMAWMQPGYRDGSLT